MLYVNGLDKSQIGVLMEYLVNNFKDVISASYKNRSNNQYEIPVNILVDGYCTPRDKSLTEGMLDYFENLEYDITESLIDYCQDNFGIKEPAIGFDIWD